MDGSTSVSTVILNLDATAAKESILVRYFSDLFFEGQHFKSRSVIIVLLTSVCVCPELLSCATGLDVLENIFFLMELTVEHVSKRIRLVLIMLVVGASLVVWFMVSTTCSDSDPT